MTEQTDSDREPTRFAVYDEDLAQYVTVDGSSTWTSSADAGKASKAAAKLRRHEDHKLTTRPVG